MYAILKYLFFVSIDINITDFVQSPDFSGENESSDSNGNYLFFQFMFKT